MVDKVTRILNAVETNEQKRYPTEFTCSNGVVLKLKPVSSSAVAEAQSKDPQPKVPQWYNEDKDRMEENPVHPDYFASLQKWRQDQGTIMIRVCLLLGSEVISIPDDVLKLEDDKWIEKYEDLGIAVAHSGNARYVDWLRFYILSNDDDLTELTVAIQRAGSKVPEGAVDVAADSFRNN